MASGLVIDAMRGTTWVMAQFVAPVVLPALVAGFVFGIFETTTGISVATSRLAPKLAFRLGALLLLGSLMLREFAE